MMQIDAFFLTVFIIISKHNTKIMSLINQILNRVPFIREIQLETLDLIEYQDSEDQIDVFLNEQLKNKITLKFYGRIIVICSEQKLYSQPLGQIQIDFSIKLERIIEQSFIEHSSQTSKTIRIKGFRYINQNSSLSLYVKQPLEAHRWINSMSKCMNLEAFHQFYKPIKILGKGSSASVYEITKIQDGKRLAAKVFSKEKINKSKKSYNSFINQIMILRQIQHQNLINLHEVYESDNSYFLITQHLKGGNLFEYLIQRQTALNLHEIKLIMHSILKGLRQLQLQDIIHRDIKLQNLILRDKNNLEIVIVDFGLAVHSDDEDYTYYHCGTPGYLSPQIINLSSSDKLTTKSDIFSLGVVFHILLTGKFLFQGKQQKEIYQNNKKMQFSLEKQAYKNLDAKSFSLLKKMLKINPNDRFSASDCLKDDFFDNFSNLKIDLAFPCKTYQIQIHERLQ